MYADRLYEIADWLSFISFGVSCHVRSLTFVSTNEIVVDNENVSKTLKSNKKHIFMNVKTEMAMFHLFNVYAAYLFPSRENAI